LHLSIQILLGAPLLCFRSAHRDAYGYQISVLFQEI
jgi:hypothetical protein